MTSICDELEPLLQSSGFLDGAAFSTVSVVFRFGNHDGGPELERVSKRHSELPVAMELRMADLKRLEYPALRGRLRDATLCLLAAVAEKYGLPGARLAQLAADSAQT